MIYSLSPLVAASKSRHCGRIRILTEGSTLKAPLIKS